VAGFVYKIVYNRPRNPAVAFDIDVLSFALQGPEDAHTNYCSSRGFFYWTFTIDDRLYISIVFQVNTVQNNYNEIMMIDYED